MKNKKIVIVAFLLLVLAQLYVPAKMIWEKEKLLANGKEFKFITAPVDPNDPFRGKYVQLRFQQNSFPIPEQKDWKVNQEIYAKIGCDEEGFAKVEQISKERRADWEFYCKLKVRSIYKYQLYFTYPFDRFYMEESKAYEAEKIYREAHRDQQQTTYALVTIKNGEAVLKDVCIDGVPIRELVVKKR
jgi:uncharacterized membrane-anchored protein